MGLSALATKRDPTPSQAQRLEDHRRIVAGYLDTHSSRNHAEKTRLADERFLTKWLLAHGRPDEGCPLFVWEAMEPVRGRERVMAYVKGSVEEEHVASSTLMQRIGALRRFFDYILQWPYIPESGGVSIQARYGPIEQPVLVYDYPTHVWHGRREDAPLTRPELQGFYDFLHRRLTAPSRRPATAARNYTMFVVAAESGLRVHEVCALDLHRDLLFASGRLQTREGKGFRGSGPRVRQTIFTPFAQATVGHYVEHVRPAFRNWSHSAFLFLSELGGSVSEESAKYALKRIAAATRAAGLRVPPRFGWHSLRRSFATIFMEERPESPWVLMEMLGHLNPGTLHHYVHHPRAYHDRVMDDVIAALIRR